jgi:Cu/Ag efflux pump CusA
VRVHLRLAKASRWGINVADVQDAIQTAVGAKSIAGWIPQENSLPARTISAPRNPY